MPLQSGKADWSSWILNRLDAAAKPLLTSLRSAWFAVFISAAFFGGRNKLGGYHLIGHSLFGKLCFVADGLAPTRARRLVCAAIPRFEPKR